MSNTIDDTVPCVDVAIIGGGPAGTSAALTLLKRTDISVLVAESGDYNRLKAGESLSPGVRNLLDYLTIWESFSNLGPVETWGNQAAWGSSELASFDFIFNVHGHGWAIDRNRFERMMAELVEARGGELLRNTRCHSINKTDDGYLLTLRQPNGTDRHLNARVVIDAGGRTSRWNDSLHHRHDDLVGASTLLPAVSHQPTAAVTTVETCADGWWYAAPVPHGRVAISFMSDSDIIHQRKLSEPDKWFARLKQTHHISRLINLPNAVAEIRVDPAFSACLVPASGTGIIATGDAAASFDPLSSGGIPHALATGIQAARVASDRLHGEGHLFQAYETAIARDFRQYLRTRWQIYSMENRFAKAPFWQRRQTPVSLPPESMLMAIHQERSQTVFIPRQVVDQIIDLAHHPISASELVGRVQSTYPTLPAERVILGVQDMIGNGLTQCTPD
ncbi:tryptophan 7-halogenase [Thalassospira alkalitolerans]|uniref:FAD-binding domain-containing protein n=1 Tax=Thalassospira alkalitolerans TaxID=1293890 RepID=A0A1Y2LA75_9PROT|nr:tryptophan 7-halogenase [Thalassospira alkalitolerans]OSQ47421.1 hypothetical protein TALK_12810 [Thalassospira alkalitolerans]|tara:strand:- start:53651 stop:54991 length:1341 start_codon:yes stop_codon:yes gene_type:complete